METNTRETQMEKNTGCEKESQGDIRGNGKMEATV